MAKLIDNDEYLPGDLLLRWCWGGDTPPGWTKLPDDPACYKIAVSGEVVKPVAAIRYAPGDPLIPEPDGQGTSDHEDCHICDAYSLWNWIYDEEQP